jgi:hypothetical protein
MDHKSFFQRLDVLILAVIIVIAAAMSGTSLRFGLSKIDIANQTNTLVPYVTKNSQQTLQFNNVNFKTTQPTPGEITFSCPGKTQPAPQPQEPQPSCPQQQCGICKNDGTCETMTLTVCSGTCPSCAQRQCVPVTPPPPVVIPVVTPIPVTR